ncbi:gp24 [Klebsiella pneumoniae]|uniref:Gp24 n=1 Tax=Klebsiella pneumoniae TaxID=573 RepID=A0A377WKQ4_KLEPN|nr:gp24 [Klebsiella pneumoniae]
MARGNNKLRIGNSAGQPVFERPYNSGTVGTKLDPDFRSLESDGDSQPAGDAE